MVDEDQIWRISSLTAYVDDETKILLLPVPESKRKVKIMDTKYTFNKVGDLMNTKKQIEGSLAPVDANGAKEMKRFEDKTKEEIRDETHKKKQQQMSKLLSVRKWQLCFFTFCGGFYFFVYRQFLCPKSIMNSVLYHNAVRRAN
jgi:hypothetical protein